MTKALARKNAKSILQSLSADYKEFASRKICEKVINLPEFIGAKNIFVYLSTANEPDTSLIIKTAFEMKKNVFAPVCKENRKMQSVKIYENSCFIKSSFNIREPAKQNEVLSPGEIDFIICPCLALTKSGKRLGHGGGYYDIFLQKIDKPKAGLCFEKLIFENIPTDEHDILMDIVISEG